MHGHILPAYENVALTVNKKDRKYYRKLQKQRDLDEKLRLVEVRANLNFKKAVSPQSVPPVAVSLTESVSISVHDAHTSGSAPPPSAKSFDEYVTVSPADVALFAVGSYVSIISDTSQRGYKGNRVFGKVTAVYLSADGTYLYDELYIYVICL
jgi:hypothetical protein